MLKYSCCFDLDISKFCSEVYTYISNLGDRDLVIKCCNKHYIRKLGDRDLGTKFGKMGYISTPDGGDLDTQCQLKGHQYMTLNATAGQYNVFSNKSVNMRLELINKRHIRRYT